MSDDRRRVLVVSWSPAGESITAGGFRRTLEILRRWRPEDGELLVIDAHPSYLAPIQAPHRRVFTYRIPRPIKHLVKISFPLSRVLEWLVAGTKIIAFGVRHRREYDIVHVPFSELPVVSLAGAVLGWLGKEVVYCNQNTDGPLLWWLINNPLHNYAADRLITISRQLRRDLMAQGKRRRPFFINYVGLDWEDAVKTPPQPVKYEALFIGRHIATKGVFDYVKVLATLVPRHPHFRFASVGVMTPEVKRELTAELQRRGLTKHWQYLGTVSEAEKFRLIKASRSVWFLSTLEGWGIVPQEALACGVLPLCYDIPVYKENIRACPAVFLVPPGDWQAAARRAEELLTLPMIRRRTLAEQGRQFVKRFDWESVARREAAIITGRTRRLVP